MLEGPSVHESKFTIQAAFWKEDVVCLNVFQGLYDFYSIHARRSCYEDYPPGIGFFLETVDNAVLYNPQEFYLESILRKRFDNFSYLYKTKSSS